MRTTGAIVLAVLAGFAAASNAQVSLSSAVDLALRNDPKVKQAQADVDKARAALSEAHDTYVPNVGVSGGYGGSAGVPLNVPQVFSISSESLLFNFSQKDFVRAAASGLHAAKLTLQEAREKVTEDVVVTYLALESAQHRQAEMTEEHQFAAKLVTIVDKRLRAGQDTRMELLRARLRADQIQYTELQTEDDIASLSDHLARLIGLPGNQLIAVSSSIPPLPPVNSLSADTTTLKDSFGVQAAFANAKSKQEIAFGDSRYRFRPQLSFGANYSRISTAHTSYPLYYPGFAGGHLSDNALSIGIQIAIPLFDRGHEARAREAAAEAASLRFGAEDSRNQFLEGRAKLQHSLAELQAGSRVAEDEQEYAEEQLNATLVQLSSTGSGNPNGPEMTPKDEQNARLQVEQKKIDLLNTQQQLRQAEVNLMRQTGQLDSWLNSGANAGSSVSGAPAH